MTTKLTTPIVHVNGSGRNALMRQQLEAAEALDKAIEALQAAAPHGRDYYPLGEHAYPKAHAEWQDRMQRLRSVFEELHEIFKDVDKQGGR